MNKDHGKWLKAYGKAIGKEVLPDIKLRKIRAKELAPRKPYNREEALLRQNVIRHLRKHGCEVARIENSICGINNSGVPDLWIVCKKTKWMGWCELKSLDGRIQPHQQEFADMCFYCGVKHLFVRRLEELEVIYK